MAPTITIRADDNLRRALDARAEAEGKSISVLVREILSEALVQRTTGERIGHLRGRLTLAEPGNAPWREQIRGRNWRP